MTAAIVSGLLLCLQCSPGGMGYPSSVQKQWQYEVFQLQSNKILLTTNNTKKITI
jgi:hypothetical protein